MKINKKNAIRLALVLLLAVGIYGILPQFGAFKGTFSYIHLDSSTVINGMFFSLMTYVFAALVYRSLAIKPLKFARTLVMQLSAMFINRLLPGGVGALGMNAAYLHKEKHTLTQSGIIVGLNNLIGIIGHTLLFGIFYIFARDSYNFSPFIDPKLKTYLLIAFGLSALILFIVLKRQSAKRLRDFKKQLKQTAAYYRDKPMKLLLALVFAMGITASFTACLQVSLHSTGVDVSFAAALLLLTIGVGAGTAIPSPGGLGALEAGIYGGLVSGLHADPKPALAGVLVFRLLSYWVPLAIGLFAFLYTQKKNYIGIKI